MAEHSCHVVQEYEKSMTKQEMMPLYLIDHLRKVKELITSIQISFNITMFFHTKSVVIVYKIFVMMFKKTKK